MNLWAINKQHQRTDRFDLILIFNKDNPLCYAMSISAYHQNICNKYNTPQIQFHGLSDGIFACSYQMILNATLSIVHESNVGCGAQSVRFEISLRNVYLCLNS